jgi:hypothetical protein
MTLVVNELEQAYKDRVAFKRLDALSDQGKAAYEAYQLRGHPMILIFDTNGQLVGQILGEQPIDRVTTALDEALAP